MYRLLCFFSLLFLPANGKTCESGYMYYKSEDVCLAVSTIQIWLSQMEGFCKDQMNGGVPFVRRMSDELFEEFANKQMEMARRSPMDVFVGMSKEGMRSTKWIYNNDEGDVEQSQYPYWTRDPMGEDCAVMKINEDFKMGPYGCTQSTFAMCEKKEEPCYHARMFYVEYFGRCISSSIEKADYPKVEFFCEEGHVMTVKDEDSRETAAAALYTFPTAVFSGLRKTDDNWVYETGEAETERFARGGPGQMDCGVIGLTMDNEAKMFTGHCEGKYRVICEKTGKSI